MIKALFSLPIATRRVFRLAFGAGLATLVSYALVPSSASNFLLLVLIIMIPPMPPPVFKALIKLMIILVLAILWGIFLGITLSQTPVVGLVLFLVGMIFTIGLGLRKPALGVVSMLFIVGQTIVAVLSFRSPALGVSMMFIMLSGFLFAFFIAWISHLFFLRESRIENTAKAAPNDDKWIPVRASLIMFPPFLMALQDLFFIPLLIKGSLLAQQIDARSAVVQVKELLLATLIGAAAALILWNVLTLWPNLFFFSLCLALVVYLLACPLYKVWRSAYGFSFWQNTIMTLVILIGPAVSDPSFGDDIQKKMLIRIGLFLAISVYSILAVRFLDMLYNGSRMYKENNSV